MNIFPSKCRPLLLLAVISREGPRFSLGYDKKTFTPFPDVLALLHIVVNKGAPPNSSILFYVLSTTAIANQSMTNHT